MVYDLSNAPRSIAPIPSVTVACIGFVKWLLKYGKQRYLMVNTMVSCRFSMKPIEPIHGWYWQIGNQGAGASNAQSQRKAQAEVPSKPAGVECWGICISMH